MKKQKGFTLIELLVVMGIIAILASVVIIALNPARQFAQARDTQRNSNVNAILNAIGQNMADNQGVFTCGDGPLPATSTYMYAASIDANGYDIADCIVPTYIPAMPVDPSANGTDEAADSGVAAYWNDSSDYSTSYTVMQDGGLTGRVTVSAPYTEIASGTISITR